VEVSRPGFPSGGDVSAGATVRAALCKATYADAALWIVARLADGLSHAHEQGILHRDLKPANVLLADDGRPMLLDFSLAVDAAGDAPPGGTLPYMAPEQLEAFLSGARSLDPRSDLYGLGVILFQVLTGRLPYPAREPSPEGIAAAVGDRRLAPANVRLLNLSVPESTAEVVRRLLDRDPAHRFESAAALRADLDARLPHLPPSAAHSSWARRLIGWIGWRP
jgi:serine/threonine protein kinase